MKSILLTTTAIVAFAGAAAADGHTGISFSGDFSLGYNDDDTQVTGEPAGVTVGEDGFYWDGNLDVTATAALDNGVTATLTGEMNISSDDAADGSRPVVFDEVTLVVATETASLSFGDVDPVAEDNYGGVDGDTTDGFFDLDAHFDVVGFDAMLVGEATVGAVTAMISYGVLIDDSPSSATLTEIDTIDALQLYATADLGMFSVEGAYQQGFGEGGTGAGVTDNDVFAISATAMVAGAELTGAYIDDETESSFGLGASYPVGPVTLSGYYSVNDVAEDNYGVEADYADGPIAVNAFYDFEGGATDADGDDTTEFGIEGSYDTGLNLTVLGGYISTDAAGTETDALYAAGVYDLGGGAELLVAYAEDDNDQNDEIGDPEYLPGTTVEVSFSF